MRRAILASILILASVLACSKATPIPSASSATTPIPSAMPRPTFIPTPAKPTIATPPSLTPPPIVTVRGEWNCRAKPDRYADVIQVIPNGATIQLTGLTDRGWTQVFYKDRLCWIAGY